MNNDYLDDIVTVETNQMTIQKQLPTGGFTPVVYPLPALTANPGWSITAGDFNKDGIVDLTDEFEVSDEIYYSKMDAMKENLEKAKEMEILEDFIWENYFNDN